jgi:serine/threonine protein kinase
MSTSADLTHVAQAICADRNLSFIGPAGEGTFKQTFRVQEADGTLVALKVYKPGYDSERSDREIHAMETCDHPNIARLYALAHFDCAGQDHLYTLEEFFGGGTLTNRIMTHGIMDTATVISLGNDLIDAVGHIASHRFVHRDLKPDNIMFRVGSDTPVVVDSDTPVVVDFGIVRDLTAATLTADWMPMGPGTPYFAAPEQLNNSKQLIDWRTDQFSLGVVLAVCGFGQHPYDSTGNAAVTIQTVGTRGPLAPAFRHNVQQSGLIALERMVAG